MAAFSSAEKSLDQRFGFRHRCRCLPPSFYFVARVSPANSQGEDTRHGVRVGERLFCMHDGHRSLFIMIPKRTAIMPPPPPLLGLLLAFSAAEPGTFGAELSFVFTFFNFLPF